MPAVDIARLKNQAAVLVEKFDQPAVLLKELHVIFDLYAERTLRQGLVAAPISVLPAYRVQASVLRQIDMELGPLASIFPEQTLALVDALWQDGYLETRLLAAALIGRISPENTNLFDRVKSWVSVTRDEQLLRMLLETSLSRSRRETPGAFLRLMREWLDPEFPKTWSIGMQAIIPMVNDPEYENLPPIFNILSPVIKIMPSKLQNELADLIKALYNASPVETVYFLRQTISGSNSPQLAITLRRVLPQLPEALQPLVLEIVRQKSSLT